MKIRTCFVSNSSSTSFKCVVCHETYNGWDLKARDVDHMECVKGHIFCEEHLINRKLFEELVEKFEEFDKNDLPPKYYEEPKYLEKYGVRLQMSVFELEHSTRLLNVIEEQIKQNFEPLFEDCDSIFIFYTDLNKAVRYGASKHLDNNFIFMDFTEG